MSVEINFYVSLHTGRKISQIKTSWGLISTTSVHLNIPIVQKFNKIILVHILMAAFSWLLQTSAETKENAFLYKHDN